MIIDMHAHVLPQSTLDALAGRASEFPSVQLIQADEQYRLAFAGHPPTGRSYELLGSGFFEVKDGRIVHQRGYWDKASWFAQLGIAF